MGESYDDLGGGHHEDPYTVTGAIENPCPKDAGGCGAETNQKCTFRANEYRAGLGVVEVTKTRSHPCLVRIPRVGRAK